MRATAMVAAVAVAVAACSVSGDRPEPSIPDSSTSIGVTSTTAGPAPVTYRVERCDGTIPRAWSVLCQAVALIDEYYVAEPHPADLAAAAVLGVESAELELIAPPTALGPCVAPSEVFERLCPVVMEGAAIGRGSVEDRVEAAVQGIFRYGLDPFSSYIEPDLAERFEELAGGIVLSLGLAASARLPDGEACGPVAGECRFRVSAVFPFGVGDRAGIVAGDVISEIDGHLLAGRSADEAVVLLLGEAGETVTLSIVRDGGAIQKTLIHEDIRFDPVEYELLPGNIAYLRLNDFSQLAAQLVGLALESSEVGNSRGLILDLRANPGGLLLSAQAIASQFLRSGVVMVEEGRSERYEWPVVEGGLAPRLPLVVLTSRDSASAAEIVAAALQEAGRATVIGDRTFGKNAVQFVFRARNGGEFRITTSRWTTAGGTDVGVFGLEPDILVQQRAVGDDDPVLDRAITALGG